MAMELPEQSTSTARRCRLVHRIRDRHGKVPFGELPLQRARETAKVLPFRVNLKSASHTRPIKMRQRLVGSHVDSIDPAVPDLLFSRTHASPKWDRRFVLAAAFFVGCLALVAFGL